MPLSCSDPRSPLGSSINGHARLGYRALGGSVFVAGVRRPVHSWRAPRGIRRRTYRSGVRPIGLLLPLSKAPRRLDHPISPRSSVRRPSGLSVRGEGLKERAGGYQTLRKSWWGPPSTSVLARRVPPLAASAEAQGVPSQIHRSPGGSGHAGAFFVSRAPDFLRKLQEMSPHLSKWALSVQKL